MDCGNVKIHLTGGVTVLFEFYQTRQCCLLSVIRLYLYQPMEIKSPTKKFWPLGIDELQLAVDPLGGS